MLEESVSSAPTFWAALNSWLTPTVFFVLLQLVIATIYITSNLANGNGNRKQHQHQEQQERDSQGVNGQHPQQQPRSPSALQRLKSLNFYTHRSQEEGQNENAPEYQIQNPESENPPIARSPSVLQPLKSNNLCKFNFFPTQPVEVIHNTHEPEVHHLELQDTVVVEEIDEDKEDDHSVGEIQPEQPEPGPSLDEIYSKLQGPDFKRAHSDTKPTSVEVPLKLPTKMNKSASTKSPYSHFKEDEIVENRRPMSVKEATSSAAEDGGEVDAMADDFINRFKQQLKLQRINSIVRHKEMISGGSGK